MPTVTDSVLAHSPGLITRIRTAWKGRPGLDSLLMTADPAQPLLKRLRWLVELLTWIRLPGLVAKQQLDFASGQGQAARLRHLLSMLERNPEHRTRVARMLRSILRDIDSLELFRSTGMPSNLGLWSEAWVRLNHKIMPAYVDGSDLGEAFDLLFPRDHDADWLARLDEATLLAVAELLHYDLRPEDGAWNTFPRDMQQALLLLADEAKVLAMSPMFRRRRPAHVPSAFAELHDQAMAFIKTGRGPTLDEPALAALLARCHGELAELRTTMRERGVSLDFVFYVTLLESFLRRMATLAALLEAPANAVAAYRAFLLGLIAENHRRHSLGALWEDVVTILSRRIADRNADTGEHYITRTVAEYRRMFRQAAGGGALTGLTVLMKAFLTWLHLPLFLTGLAFSINYTASFIIIQLCNCTLATKQPAMTAAYLASTLASVRDDRSLRRVVHEVLHLVRSQLVAIMGNVLLVIPVSAALLCLIDLMFGQGLVGPTKAKAIIAQHQLIGQTPLFAAFTGGLLWLSSIAGGWVDNWVALHRLPDVVAGSRQLQIIAGTARAKALAAWIHRHAAGIGSSVALGCMLGIVPLMFSFVGIGIDVRHVTLASGSLTLAAVTLGSSVLRQPEFWWAVAGIVAIGLINVAVSFALAMAVALRATPITPHGRRRFYRYLVAHVVSHPTQLLLPVGLPAAPAATVDAEADTALVGLARLPVPAGKSKPREPGPQMSDRHGP